MVIASRSNPRIKQIRALRSRKHRESTGLFFIEGARLLAEAVQTGAAIEALVVAPDLLTSPFGREIACSLELAGVRRLEVTPEVFDSLALRDSARGIGAVVRQRWQPLEAVGLSDRRCWIAVDAIQNPGNLGTILRTSAAVGGAGVILIGETTDPYDPSAVRATLGALFSQRLVRSTFAEFADWKRRRGYPVVGTSPSAPTDYKQVTYRPPPVLLMGGERSGLSPEQQALCDLVVRIQMIGRCDSLNLGVATSLLLYEIFNQQRAAAQADPPSATLPG
jgi:TrmH family RNA methyltransferase